MIVQYSSNRYAEALDKWRNYKGTVVAVTSDLARRLGLIERTGRQRELFNADV
jgi:hypothetical protein